MKDFEVQYTQKDGTLRWASLSIKLYPERDLLESAVVDISERKLAEEALHKSEERFRGLVETMNDGLGAMDKNGIITYVNNSLCNTLDYSAEEMIGSRLIDFLDETNREILKNQQQKRKPGEAPSYEITMLDKDGRPVTFIASPNSFFDSEGNITSSFAVLTNITERKQAEKAVENLARFPRENPNPVLRISKNGVILYANRASRPLLNTWQCRLGKHIPTEWYRYITKTLSSERIHRAEIDCSKQTFSLTFSPIPQGNYVNVYALDITERKQAEVALRESERYHTLFDSASDSIFIVSLDGEFMEVNQVVCERLGYKQEELRQMTIADIVAPQYAGGGGTMNLTPQQSCEVSGQVRYVRISAPLM